MRSKLLIKPGLNVNIFMYTFRTIERGVGPTMSTFVNVNDPLGNCERSLRQL